MAAEREYHWADDALVPGAARPPHSVVASDSWSVDGGLALALDVHRERFAGSVEVTAPERAAEVSAFWSAAVSLIPAAGSWFPRVDLAVPREGAEAEFRVSIRPAPPKRESLTLVTASHDPRLLPGIKGPDLLRLEELRDEARRAGADEAVMLSSGFVVEGNYTSLVWWRGDALCVVDDDFARLPGVTERSLVTLATALGVEILHDTTSPDDLEGLEVWALNSLHGARIATRWTGGPTLAEEPGRLRLWRSRLDALRRPVA